MTDTPLSDWLPVRLAAIQIGCSTRTVERLAHDGKLERRLRPQAGSPAVAVYNPADVARLAAERQPAPAPFVLGVGTGSNGNHLDPSGSTQLQTRPSGSIGPDELIRGLALLISKALQSPPSPTVATSVSETLWVTVKEAAAILGFPQADVHRLLIDGDLNHRRTSRGGIRIRRKDLEAL